MSVVAKHFICPWYLGASSSSALTFCAAMTVERAAVGPGRKSVREQKRERGDEERGRRKKGSRLHLVSTKRRGSYAFQVPGLSDPPGRDEAVAYL
jgi:hypothetical protein